MAFETDSAITETENKRNRARKMLRLLKWQRVLSPSGIAMWTVLIAIAGGLASGYQWLETRKFEAQKPFREARLTAYIEAIRIAGRITEPDLSTDTDVWKNNVRRFWEMRWGELEMLGDAGTRNAARLIGEYIIEIERPASTFNRHYLRWAVGCLADELRYSIEHDWGLESNVTRLSPLMQKRVSKVPDDCVQENVTAIRREGMP